MEYPFFVGNTSSKGRFSIAMLDYRSVDDFIISVGKNVSCWATCFAFFLRCIQVELGSK